MLVGLFADAVVVGVRIGLKLFNDIEFGLGLKSEFIDDAADSVKITSL